MRIFAKDSHIFFQQKITGYCKSTFFVSVLFWRYLRERKNREIKWPRKCLDKTLRKKDRTGIIQLSECTSSYLVIHYVITPIISERVTIVAVDCYLIA